MLFRSDRKSTRLNSSHTIISYAVFCLKKKKKESTQLTTGCPTPAHDRPQRVTAHRSPSAPRRVRAHTLMPTLYTVYASVFFFLITRPPPNFPPFPSRPLFR